MHEAVFFYKILNQAVLRSRRFLGDRQSLLKPTTLHITNGIDSFRYEAKASGFRRPLMLNVRLPVDAFTGTRCNTPKPQRRRNTHEDVREVRRHDSDLNHRHAGVHVSEHNYQTDHVFFSETRTYMALMMGATMAVIMLSFLLKMHTNQRMNIGIYVGSAVVFSLALWLVRSQATVDQVSYMKAMIPHHSIAILTSERAHIEDPRVRDLADKIMESQRREIPGFFRSS